MKLRLGDGQASNGSDLGSRTLLGSGSLVSDDDVLLADRDDVTLVLALDRLDLLEDLVGALGLELTQNLERGSLIHNGSELPVLFAVVQPWRERFLVEHSYLCYGSAHVFPPPTGKRFIAHPPGIAYG